MKLTTRKKIAILLIAAFICILGFYVGITHSNSFLLRLLDSPRAMYLYYCLLSVSIVGFVAWYVKCVPKTK
jgi:hypothetical protein